MSELLEFRDHIYYLHTVQSDKEVSVQLDIYKCNSPESFLKVKNFKILSSILMNVTGMCAGIVKDNQDSYDVNSFLIAIETKVLHGETEYMIKIYKLKLESILDNLPSSTVQVGICTHHSTSFKNISYKPQFVTGPSLVWITCSNINYFPCYESTLLTHPISDELFVKFVLLQVNVIQNSETLHQPLLLICQKLDDKNYQASLCFFILYYDTEDLEIQSIKPVPMNYFVPEEYEYLISTITVSISVDASLENKTRENSDKFNMVKQNHTCIVTTNNQFLVFVKGYPRYVCQVPSYNFSKIYKIQQYFPYSCTFVIQGGRGLCLIQRNNIKKIEIVKKCEKASRVVFGDFLQNNTCQLVYLMKSAKNSDPNFFLENIPKFQGLNDPNPELQNKLGKIQEALQRRLLLSQITYNRVEDNLRDKQGVLESAISSLRIVQHTGTLPLQVNVPEHLVNIHTQRNNFQPSKQVSRKTPELNLKLISQWDCAFNDYWAMGFTMLNDSTHIITNLCGIVATESFDAIYKQFNHQISEIPSQPILKIEEDHVIKPHQMTSLVLLTRINNMLKPNLECNIIIKWTVIKSDLKIEQQVPFILNINIEDIVCNQKFNDLPVMQKLMVFRALHKETELTVMSACIPLHSIERMLLENKLAKGFPYPYNFNGQTHYLFSDQISTLFGVNFDVNLSDETKSIIHVHCRTENQLLTFTHWLYSILPKGFLIFCDNILEKGHNCEAILNGLKEELELIFNTMQNEPNLTLDLNESNIVKKRTNEMIDKLKETSFKITYTEYLNFRKSLLQLEIRTDQLMEKILL